MRAVRWLSLGVLVALTAVTSLAPLLLGAEPATLAAVLTRTSLWYLVTGLVVMAKRPWHPIGWLLILVGLGLSTSDLPLEPADLDERWYPWLTGVRGNWGSYFTYTAVVGLLVSFPDGLSVRSVRDRKIGWSIIGLMAGMTMLAAASHPVRAVFDGVAVSEYPNPLGVRRIPVEIGEYGYLLVFAVIGGCVYWMWRRRRGEQGEDRRRYTLVLYSFGLLFPALVIGISLSGPMGDIAWWPAYVGWFWIPTAFCIAVVRHGLYGVDPIVRRTVTYLLIVALVAAVYAVPVVLVSRVVGESNDLVIAGATLAAAAVVNPARRRIQRAVDHRFDRARYDAESELGAFADRLTGEVDLDAVISDLGGVVDRTLSPTGRATWVRLFEPDGADASDRNGVAVGR